jgi:SAM-dependent methyltransferase
MVYRKEHREELFRVTDTIVKSEVPVINAGNDGSLQTFNFTRENLASLFNKLGFKKGAEIGVARGHYSETLCKEIKELRLACVDPWMRYAGNPRGRVNTEQEECFQITKKKLEGYNVKFFRTYSMEAVKEFPEYFLDFVYIDGNHCFDYVMQDLIEWGKRVRPGGIIAGDDYYEFKWAGVIEAVQAYIGAHRVKQWYLTADISNGERTKGQPRPSFFWVKE